MHNGNHAAGALLLLLTGCGGQEGELAIRTTPVPVSALPKAAPVRVAEAQALLASGNVGLALEAFRKAHRDDPQSVAALSGLAACYDEMGRFELSRRYHEQALAIAPADPQLLGALAASLTRQGRMEDAAAVRSEIAVRAARRPVDEAASLAAEAGDATDPPASSITVRLPPAVPAPIPSVRTVQAVAETEKETPRLERLTAGEVALVTSGRPQWRTELVRRTATSTTVRFVPLGTKSRIAAVRLLNAARHQGLAARTRVGLMRKGWNRVTVGDATAVRAKSLVLYSSTTEQAARRLAVEFGFGIAKEARPGPLTVLLGRDAAIRSPARG